MKKFLFLMALISMTKIFGSVEVDEDPKALQEKIAQLVADRKKIEQSKKDTEIATEKISQQIYEASARLEKIAEQQRLEKEYGQNVQHAEILEKALKAGKKIKDQKYYFDEESIPCGDAFRFVDRTYELKAADEQVKSAIYGKDKTVDVDCVCSLFDTLKITLSGCGLCGYPNDSCYKAEVYADGSRDCCDFYHKRSNAQYRLTATMALGREKLAALKTAQDKYVANQARLNAAMQQAVVSEVIEDRGEEKN